MTNIYEQSGPLSEQEKAELLSDYLEAVDNGRVFEAPEGLADAELLELTRLARSFKTSFQPAGPSEELLSAYDGSKKAKKKTLWAWLTIPVAGMAVLAVAFTLRISDPTVDDDWTVATLPTAAQVADLDSAVAEFDDLSELDEVISELDLALEEMEALLDEEAFTDMDTALAVADL